MGQREQVSHHFSLVFQAGHVTYPDRWIWVGVSDEVPFGTDRACVFCLVSPGLLCAP